MTGSDTLKYSSLAALVLQNSSLILFMRSVVAIAWNVHHHHHHHHHHNFNCVFLSTYMGVCFRYSRTRPNQIPYLSCTAVFVGECLKLLVSLFCLIREQTLHPGQQRSFELANLRIIRSAPIAQVPSAFTVRGCLVWLDGCRQWIRHLLTLIMGPQSGLTSMCVPALLYTVQNVTNYHAVALLDAATFQVTSQLKILTTALCFVVFMRRQLAYTQWIALLLLTMGVALVQYPSSSTASSTRLDLAEGVDWNRRLMGCALVLFACLLSGLAGVYFEMIVKGRLAASNPASNGSLGGDRSTQKSHSALLTMAQPSSTEPPSLWLKNVQLALVSLPCSLMAGYLGIGESGGASWLNTPMFAGFQHWSVWAAVLLNALGGLLVALVVKYADNILKGFATSLAIVVSAIVSSWLLNFHLTATFAVGAAIVMAAVFFYSAAPPHWNVYLEELVRKRVTPLTEI